MNDDPTTHYIDATDRMRRRAEAAEAENALLAQAVDDNYALLQEAKAERDRLREVVIASDPLATLNATRIREARLRAERDRLRAVVDAARAMMSRDPGEEDDYDDIAAALADLDALDGSGDMGEAPS